MKFMLLFFAAGILVSCSNSGDQNYNKEEAVTASDSVQERSDETTISNEAITTIEQSDFSKYAKSKLPQFSWNSIANTGFWKEDSMHPAPFTPHKEYFDAYGRFLKYSPDSSKFIDLDSYNVHIENVNGKLVGNDQGPDNEVSLVDLKKKQRSRLLFQGPGSAIHDGGWIDNDHLVLIGLQQNEHDTASHAVVYTFNLATGMVYMYELQDEKIAGYLKDYSAKERLKSVTMQGRAVNH